MSLTEKAEGPSSSGSQSKLPTIWWSIVFGLFGALSVEIRKSFGGHPWPTGRYWKIGAIATIVSMAPFILLIAALVALGAAVGSPNSVAQTNPGPATTVSQPAPVAVAPALAAVEAAGLSLEPIVRAQQCASLDTPRIQSHGSPNENPSLAMSQWQTNLANAQSQSNVVVLACITLNITPHDGGIPELLTWSSGRSRTSLVL